MTYRASCRCGRITLAARGEPKWVANCHCAECRASTGAAFSTYAGFMDSDVHFTGEAPSVYESSRGARRSFCGACGTPVSFEGERWPGERHLFVGTFTEGPGLAPTVDVYTKDRLPWVCIDPDLTNKPG